jgi:hypothetical protein
MTKVDKSQYSKAEWKKIRDERRRKKARQAIQEPVVLAEQKPILNHSRHVLCVKNGTKYSAEYVNTLYNMVCRNCTLPFEFVCLTDDSKGIDSDIKIIPFDREFSTWWAKPYMFSNKLGLRGTILYMDLDVVISGSIDKLFTYERGSWCVIRDFTRSMRPKWQKYNSSVIRFEYNQLDHLWRDFEKNHKLYQRKYHGDQDWLYTVADIKPALWPDEWIQSWKWEIRKSKQFAPGGTRGKRKFKDIEDVVPPSECCVAVFHGDPNPELVEDPWVKQNWK